MTIEGISGFWSYAHEDNDLDEGAILKLAHLISDEYNILSGENLKIFIDRDNIVWGEAWRDRINSALTKTTFLVPIVTPRYFTRTECRKELIEFSAQAKSLGVDKLLLPIFYAKPRNFSTDSTDEAIALIAATQYVDWTDARLLEPTSRAYRTHVNQLARRLMEIAEEVAEKQLNTELEANPEDDGSAGIADLMNEIVGLLPDWLDAVMTDPMVRGQIEAAMTQGTSQIGRLIKSRAGTSVITGARLRMAKIMLPLLQHNFHDAQIYLTRSAELDPLVSGIIRLVNEHPESFPLVAPLREAIDEAMLNIKKDIRKDEETRTQIQDFFRSQAHVGRIIQKCAITGEKAHQMVMEGNDIVRRWNAELVPPEFGLPAVTAAPPTGAIDPD